VIAIGGADYVLLLLAEVDGRTVVLYIGHCIGGTHRFQQSVTATSSSSDLQLLTELA
jgi:hypothetical protein